MATLKINCKHCSQKLEVDEVWLGMALPCPFCKKSITIERERKIDSVIRYNVPCLWVAGDRGGMSLLPFSFQYTKEDKPLRIAVTDDTPGGSGNEIRNNLWGAAIAAAMLKNKTMHGVKITVEFQGNVDGPSAGGVSCLAILSAMEGLDLPDDFAMTGTIFPDGSIGVVGGVIEKVIGAARQGKKRVLIPGYHRMIADASGRMVDVVRLAEELRIKIFLVQNVEEAFAIVHNRPYAEKGYIDAASVTAVPREIEDLFVREYQKYNEKINESIVRFTSFFCSQEEYKQAIRKLAAICSTLFEHKEKFEQGKFLSAFDDISVARQMWQVIVREWSNYKSWKVPFWGSADKKLIEIHDSNVERYNQKLLPRLREYISKSKDGFVPAKRGLTPIVAQFEQTEISGMAWGLKYYFEELIDETSFDDVSDEGFETLKDVEFVLRIIMEAGASDEHLGFAKVGEMLPQIYPAAMAAQVENLFKTAHEAIRLVAADGVEDVDLDLCLAQGLSNIAQMNHENISSASNPDYHIQVSLKTQVEAFSTWAVKLTEEYKNLTGIDFEKAVIRNARSNALYNIKECVDAGIPCIEPIRAFQDAEFQEDDVDHSLKDYWYAGLYAKALYLSFKNENCSGNYVNRCESHNTHKADNHYQASFTVSAPVGESHDTHKVNSYYSRRVDYPSQTSIQDAVCPRCRKPCTQRDLVYPISYGSVQVMVCRSCYYEKNGYSSK